MMSCRNWDKLSVYFSIFEWANWPKHQLCQICKCQMASCCIKSSISSHSKPHTMTCTRLLKCFVLHHSVIKTKHLRNLVWCLEFLEILGLTVNFSIQVLKSKHFVCLTFWDISCDSRAKIYLSIDKMWAHIASESYC